jgi:hypothetical protein
VRLLVFGYQFARVRLDHFGHQFVPRRLGHPAKSFAAKPLPAKSFYVSHLLALVDPIIGADTGGNPNALNPIGLRQGLLGSSTAPGWTCFTSSERISRGLTQTFND